MVMKSSGPAASEQCDSMGRYKLVNGIERKGFPVWKHEKYERYLLCGDDGRWTVSSL